MGILHITSMFLLCVHVYTPSHEEELIGYHVVSIKQSHLYSTGGVYL